MAPKNGPKEKLGRLRNELVQSIARLDAIEAELEAAVREAERLRSKVAVALSRRKASTKQAKSK